VISHQHISSFTNPTENLALPCYHLPMPWGLLIVVLVIIAVYLVAAVWRYLRQWLQPDRGDGKP
jgi:membrane protein implicated in regulation of membrane protease activity